MLVLGLPVLRPANRHQLDFLELVLANEPPRILPRRARLGAEARGEGGKAVVRNKSSANLGNCPVPNTASSRTSSGGAHSV